MFCHADNPQNYKSSEEAQVHQSGEQDQLVGRPVRTQLVRDLCGQLGYQNSRDDASSGGPDEGLRNPGVDPKQQETQNFSPRPKDKERENRPCLTPSVVSCSYQNSRDDASSGGPDEGLRNPGVDPKQQETQNFSPRPKDKERENRPCLTPSVVSCSYQNSRDDASSGGPDEGLRNPGVDPKQQETQNFSPRPKDKERENRPCLTPSVVSCSYQNSRDDASSGGPDEGLRNPGVDPKQQETQNFSPRPKDKERENRPCLTPSVVSCSYQNSRDDASSGGPDEGLRNPGVDPKQQETQNFSPRPKDKERENRPCLTPSVVSCSYQNSRDDASSGGPDEGLRNPGVDPKQQETQNFSPRPKDKERENRPCLTPSVVSCSYQNSRDDASSGGPDEGLRNPGVDPKQQGCVAAAARARKRRLDEFIKKRKTSRHGPRTRKGRTVRA
ncbi:hypothetical protein M513_13830 [Trichuris suis]|uniref:Uncharacterized protein n=1 Tax=Trichuris suis TaxID=68888 RepID=A0A085LJZ7_9BILA|nr:hypothetical protein M513_13830 [Trichuris suis]